MMPTAMKATMNPAKELNWSLSLFARVCSSLRSFTRMPFPVDLSVSYMEEPLSSADREIRATSASSGTPVASAKLFNASHEGVPANRARRSSSRMRTNTQLSPIVAAFSRARVTGALRRRSVATSSR